MSQPVPDNTTGADLADSGTNTFSHTCSSGAGRVLYVEISYWSASDGAYMVTYAGVELMLVSDSGLSPQRDRVTIWRLINPASGANNVVLTSLNGNGTGRCHAVSFTGADQNGPERWIGGATGTGNDTAPTVSVPSDISDDIVLDGMATDDTGTPTVTMVADTGRTQIGNGGAAGERGCCSRHTSPTNPEVMGWTRSTSGTWAIAAVSIRGPRPAVVREERASMIKFPKQIFRARDESGAEIEPEAGKP